MHYANAPLTLNTTTLRRPVLAALCVKTMNKISALLLLLCFLCSEVSAGRTVTGQDFYGTWSTVSSILSPKRQMLELSQSGGRWVSITDQGEESIRKLNESDIMVKEDLLIVDYKSKKEDLRLKLVLAGWGSKENKNIFGTVYLYRDYGDGLSLISGMPVSFESGTKQMPPQIYWSFFSNQEVEKVKPGYINKLEQGLKKIEDISILESEKSIDYSLKELKYIISITKQGQPSYPSAIGFRPSSDYSKPMSTVGKFEGDSDEFKEYYKSHLADLEKIHKETKEELQRLFKKIEAHSTKK